MATSRSGADIRRISIIINLSVQTFIVIIDIFMPNRSSVMFREIEHDAASTQLKDLTSW